MSDLAEFSLVGHEFGFPFMLKNKRLAYDGRGNAVVNEPSQIETAFEKLGGTDIYAERGVKFTKELAVMVVSRSEAILSN